MIPTLPRLSQSTKIITSVLVALFIVFYLSSTHSDEIKQQYHSYKVGEKEVFIEQSFQTSVDGPFDDTAIRALCGNATWTEGLIFSCGAPQGGIGNVRNVFLNCVRYAIEGGGAFVVPNIMARSPSDVRAITTDDIVPFSYFFDQSHFMNTLQNSCPQLRLYSHINDLYDLPSTSPAIRIAPQDLSKNFLHGTVIADPSSWRPEFDRFLIDECPPRSTKHPILIELETPLFNFPTSYDSQDFVHTFGRILNFRPDSRRLAAAVLYEMSERFGWRLQPNDGIIAGAFMGAHLRTAEDAEAAGWKGYNSQAVTYIKQALDEGLTLIYLASGNQKDIKRFRAQAAEHNITTVTKLDLLKGGDLSALNKMSWDQQGLVDYEVLLRSSGFGGIDESSFAWNVALRRHALSARLDYLTGPAGQTLQDEWSWLYGVKGSRGGIASSMWP